MFLKKISSALLFLGTILVFSTSFTASAAGDGSWGYLGAQSFAVQSDEVKSTGGDFRFCTDYAATYQLYNSSYNSPGALIGTRKLGKNECAIFRNLNGYVDGSNNRAEFIVAKKMIGSPVIDMKKAYVKFYD